MSSGKDKTTQYCTMEPLNFCIPREQEHHADLKFKIHQVPSREETEMHDVGFVVWPAAVMLARWITKYPSLVLDHGDVLELGAGCGLVGLTAASMLRRHGQEQEQEDLLKNSGENTQETTSERNTRETAKVIFTDYNPMVCDNLTRNALLNDLQNHTSVVGLDFSDQESDTHQAWVDMEGTRHPQVGVILAADVICYSNDAVSVANTIAAALLEGGKAVLISANENHRFGVAHFEDACHSVGLDCVATTIVADETFSNNTTSKNSDEEDQQNLMRDLHLANGYGNGYNFTMFTVNKPIST